MVRVQKKAENAETALLLFFVFFVFLIYINININIVGARPPSTGV